MRPMCTNGCCNAKVSAYTRRYVPTVETDEERRMHKKKAGVFVYDPEGDKVLLVQSCGRFWGPPKGSMEVGEDIATAAARELLEETGLAIPREALTQRLYLKNNSHYYFLHCMPEADARIEVQNPGSNDANCVGWFRIACLKQKLEEGKMIGNAALKQFLSGPYDRGVLAKLIQSLVGGSHDQVDEAESKDSVEQ